MVDNLRTHQLKELSKDAVTKAFEKEIYEVVSRYSKSRERIDFTGKAHHFAERMAKNCSEIFKERLGE